MTFIERAAAGEFEDIEAKLNEAISFWHNCIDNREDLPGFLGLSQSEFNAWVSDPSALNEIIKAHQAFRPLKQGS